MAVCNALPAGAGFVSSMTSYIDCEAQILGSGGWAALSVPGSTLSVVLAGFLTIFIALIGYNLLLGTSMSVREGTLAFVKIGAVFALATSWPAYRTLVYDIVIDGPGQLVAQIGPRAGVIGADGSLLQRLDLTDRALSQLAILGPGQAPMGADTQIPPPPFGGFDSFALGGSRILYLVTSIAALGSVRIVAGLMLALGPFFIAFLMFDGTRSLFEGWLRVIAGAALASVGVSIALGLELALMEPWLNDVLARRTAGEPLPTVSAELFVIAILFTIIVGAALYSCYRVTSAFRLPFRRQVSSDKLQPAQSARVSSSLSRESMLSERETERSRAAAVANVLLATARREPAASAPSNTVWSQANWSTSQRDTRESGRNITSVGRSFARRSRSRVSARAGRRDASA